MKLTTLTAVAALAIGSMATTASAWSIGFNGDISGDSDRRVIRSLDLDGSSGALAVGGDNDVRAFSETTMSGRLDNCDCVGDYVVGQTTQRALGTASNHSKKTAVEALAQSGARGSLERRVRRSIEGEVSGELDF